MTIIPVLFFRIPQNTYRSSRVITPQIIEDMEKAVQAVKMGVLSVRKASEKAKSTLGDPVT